MSTHQDRNSSVIGLSLVYFRELLFSHLLTSRETDGLREQRNNMINPSSPVFECPCFYLFFFFSPLPAYVVTHSIGQNVLTPVLP